MDNSNLVTTLLTILLPLVGAAIGYLVKHNIDKRKELLGEVTKERREMYQDFINLIIDIFAGQKTQDEENAEKISKDYLNNLHKFYKKNILYASPEVISAFADYMQFIYSLESKTNHRKNIRMLTNVMQLMRKDLGLSNHSLGSEGEILMRAIIRDFDELIA